MYNKLVQKIDLLKLLALILFALFLRLYPIFPNFFTFEYDMAKDSLIMLEMFQYKDPSLVGAVTSIPGLFNGPAWYYIALIPNIIFNFHPLASVLAVQTLVTINICLIWKYLDRRTAFFYAVSLGLISAQQNAWVPYLTTLITPSLIIILTKLKRKTQPSNKLFFLLALVTSLYFHAQSAFGVVAVILVAIYLLFSKIEIKPKHIFLAILAFVLSLSPLIIFEIKNNFIQIKAVINFVSDYQNNAQVLAPKQGGLLRLTDIAKDVLIVGGQAMSTFPLAGKNYLASIFFLYLFWSNRKKQPKLLIPILFIFGSFFLYLFLPVKAYYLVAISPFWIFGLSLLLNNQSKKIIMAVFILFALFATINAIQSKSHYLALNQSDTNLLAAKWKAIDAAYHLANGQPFRSYHFLPEVYDFSYQHLYLIGEKQGRILPTEFSYAPAETSYNPYKHVLSKSPQSNIVILIVEKYIYFNVFDDWWNRVANRYKIVDEVKVSDAITVFKAIDENFVP